MIDPDRILLAVDRRLSRTPIWDLQRRYFRQAGLAAWQEDVVPHDISSSAYMARAYADVVLGFLRDCAADGNYGLDEGQPLFIIELGAGAGRLGYHFLHHFFPRYENAPFARAPVTYVLTDFVPGLIDFWRGHERLQPWVAAGRLDFAHFDADEPAPLQLIASGRQVRGGPNPLIQIANYFFDGIPQDSFTVQDGQLHEMLVTLTSDRPVADLADPDLWDSLDFQYEAIPTAPPFYAEPLYDDLLAEYEASLADQALSFPVGALDCLHFWEDLSGGRLLLLSADKGFSRPDAFPPPGGPELAAHGSFSFMVNYHAIAAYVRRRGGLVLQPDHYQDNIQIGAFLFGDAPQGAAETRAAFAAAIGRGGPDDFFGLQGAIIPHLAHFSLAQLLSVIRLSAWDAAVLRRCLPALRQQLLTVPPVWYDDVQAVLDRVWAGFLPIGETFDLARQIGLTSEQMGHHAAAISYFEASLAAYGDSPERRAPLDRCRSRLTASG